jgi:hypothetical protein
MIDSKEAAIKVAELIGQGDSVKYKDGEWYQCISARFNIFIDDAYLYNMFREGKHYVIRVKNIEDILFIKDHEEKHRIFKSLLTLDKLSR